MEKPNKSLRSYASSIVKAVSVLESSLKESKRDPVDGVSDALATLNATLKALGETAEKELKDGNDGVSVASASIVDKKLVLTMSNGKDFSVGKVVGDDGLDGSDVDEEKLIKKILPRLPKPQFIDEAQLIQKIVKSLPKEKQIGAEEIIAKIKASKSISYNELQDLPDLIDTIRKHTSHLQGQERSVLRGASSLGQLIDVDLSGLTKDAQGNYILTTGGAVEGTAVISTGEVGANKFLREDGDGTSSWQTPPGGGNVAATGTPLITEYARWTDATTIEGRTKAQTQADLDIESGVDFDPVGTDNSNDNAVNSSSATAAQGATADTASQPGHTHVAADVTDFEAAVTANASVTANTAKVTYPSADSTKVGNITVTQAVDLDQMETDINALSDGMTYKGDWAANAGTFPGGGTAALGSMYYVSVGGTVDSIVFAAGDNIVATVDNASTTVYAANWSKHDQTDAVASVNTKVGSVVLDTSDISEVTNLYYTEGRVTANTSVAANTAKVTNATHTGDVTGDTALTIAADAVTMDMIVDVATDTFLGRVTAATGTVEVLTNAQAKTALDLTGTNSGDETEASIAEVDTGTNTTNYVSPDSFQGSKRNIRWLTFNLVEAGTATAIATNIGGDFVSPIAGVIQQSDTTPFYLYATNSTAGTHTTVGTVVDISIGGTSIMTTNKLDFDTTEKTTTTAATPPDLTTTALAVGDIITIDVDTIADGTAALGLTVYMAVLET
jgi:hypothetical protein